MTVRYYNSSNTKWEEWGCRICLFYKKQKQLISIIWQIEVRVPNSAKI